MAHQNVEIKARCNRQDRIREVLSSRDAVFKGTDHQIDTYFNVKTGRLKLREGNIENCLIHYSRSDIEGPKLSEVDLYQTAPGSSLKDLLVKALGVLVIVDKRREIYFIGNVKFHLDEVKGLGDFVEIEAIDAEGSLGLDHIQRQCQSYRDLFNIADSDLVSCSYSDMLLDASGSGRRDHYDKR
ncbi:MAG: class IV adenylate cyclase [Nanoarchaeota archaeon]